LRIDAGDAEAERDPGPSTKRRKAHGPSDGEHESEIEVRHKVKTTEKMKAKPARPPLSSDDDDMPAPPSKTTLSRAKLDAVAKRTPKMIVEATPSIPSPVRVGSSPRRVPSVVITTLPTGSPTRTGSMLAVTAETSLPAKRERPVVARASSQSPTRTSSTPPTLVRASTKRSAATRAIQKLHDEIMPDVLNFQQEMKSKAKGKGKERIYDRSRDEGVNSSKSKGKRRASDVHSVFSSDEETRDAKRQRSSKHGVQKKVAIEDVGEAPPKSKMRPPASDDEQTSHEDEHRKPARKAEPTSNRAAEKGSVVCCLIFSMYTHFQYSSGAKNRTSDASAKSIRLMTTQVNLPDDVLKVCLVPFFISEVLTQVDRS
jgi:mediator of DNA damage checkpoint protein 1